MELKSTDLRIGNLVMFAEDQVEFTVKGIDKEGLTVENETELTWIEIETFEPIKLSEELLLRFGFEKWARKIVNEYEYYDRFVMYNCMGGTSNFEVHFVYSNYGGKEHFGIDYSIDDDEHQYIYETEHAHNLQNAFKQAAGFELMLSN